MIFTFLTTTYNHEKYITQHLESIKYQIEKYGENNRFQLIIADDNSKDNTVKTIENWLKSNKSLFYIVDVLVNNENIGTCKNYVNGVRNIKGNYFKVLAGDDIYGCDNIFNVLKEFGEYDIICSPIAPFKNNEISFDMKIHSKIYYIYKYTSMKYETISANKISIPMTPGVFLKKEILTEEVLNFISKFHLIEDRSQSIKIFEENKNLKIGFYERVTVLYRHHSQAITKTKNEKVNRLFKNDSDKLYLYVLKNSKNLLLKLKTIYRIFLSKIPNKKLAQALNFEVLFYRIGFMLNYPKYRNRINKIMEESLKPNEEHLKYIIREAAKYDYAPTT